MKKMKSRVCHLCSKTIKPRGMGGHLALAHGIREVAVNKQGYDSRVDTGGNGNKIQNVSLQDTLGSQSKKKDSRPEEPVKMNALQSQLEILPEEDKNGSCNLYMEMDIKILLARMLRYTLCSVQPSQLLQHFTILEMIQDFEKKFKCEFENVRKLNQHIRIGTTLAEHQNFIYQFGKLKYSR